MQVMALRQDHSQAGTKPRVSSVPLLPPYWTLRSWASRGCRSMPRYPAPSHHVPHSALWDNCFLSLFGGWTPAPFALAPGLLLFPGGPLWPAFSSVFLLLFLFLPGPGSALEVSASLPAVGKVRPVSKLLGRYGVSRSPASLTTVPTLGQHYTHGC